MNNKQYPTRMHEVLGVGAFEQFQIKGVSRHFFLTAAGQICSNEAGMDNNYLIDAINHGIIRHPRLSEEQVKWLRALIALEAMYLAKNKDGSVGAFTNKPTKNALYWNTNDSYVFYLSIAGTCLSDLVSWSDPEPLDIVATLKAAGVEVE